MYEYGVTGVWYASLHIGVLASLRYWLYRDRLRVPLKWMIPILAVLSFLSGGLWLVTGGVPGMAFDGYRIMLAFLMFALSCFIIKAPVAEHVFSYAFILAGNAAMETTAFYVQTNFIPQNAAYAYPAISALIMAVVLIPAARCLRRMIARLSALGGDRVWAWLDLACFSFLIMNLLVALPHPLDMSPFYPIGRYLMLLGMGGVYKASVRIMETMQAAAKTRAELDLTQRRVELQQSYYERIVAQMDEVRRMRHDLRHHRAALTALVKSGDMGALCKYLDASALAEEALPVTGNLAADSVLLYYMDGAKALGAPLETDLALERKTPLSDPDLCVVLGNLLENALEAQRYVQPESRFIRVTAKGDGESLILAVDNAFDGTLDVENGAYRSRKAGEGHGVGIASVRAVCEKYGGVLQLETDGKLFMAGIVIGI